MIEIITLLIAHPGAAIVSFFVFILSLVFVESAFKTLLNHFREMKKLEIEKIKALNESSRLKMILGSKQEQDLREIDNLTAKLEKY